MSVKLIAEEALRDALRPHRVDGNEFEHRIRARIEATTPLDENEGVECHAPMLQVAASFLPWPLIVGGKVVGGGTKASSVAIEQKLLGYIALPAISLFFLAGAALLSMAKIHSVQKDNQPSIADDQQMRDVVRQWWDRYKWPARLVFAAVIILPMVGATWLLFLLLLISFAAILVLLSGFANLGVGNRFVVAQSCLIGLVLLGQAMLNPLAGKRDVQFVDHTWITVVLLIGTLILLPFVVHSGRRLKIAGPQFAAKRIGVWGLIYASLVIPLLLWLGNPILWPATPSRIKNYVESYPEDRFSSLTCREWEIVASWAVDTGLDPDLSHARQMIDNEISGEQNPFILSSAFRMGLVQNDQIHRLTGLKKQRQWLLPKIRPPQPSPLLHLDQTTWVICALEQSGQLSPDDRDYLEQRLLASFDRLDGQTADVLEDALYVTQLLDVIGRPIDRDRYREQVHRWLCKFHSKRTHVFQIAGGFEKYEGLSSSMQTTAQAVELMKIYGVPDDLDLNWVRSYVRPLYFRPLNDKWMAAVTRNRLAHLPGTTPPTWLEILYYERSLLAAMVLVGLCLYATVSSPIKIRESEGGR